MPDKQVYTFSGYSRRLDVFVTDELPDFSRSIIQKMIKDGKVTVNGKTVKPSYPLEEGDTVEVTLPDSTAQKTKLTDLIIADGKD